MGTLSTETVTINRQIDLIMFREGAAKNQKRGRKKNECFYKSAQKNFTCQNADDL